jgi:uncharacterized FlaG/YvyC family protein
MSISGPKSPGAFSVGSFRPVRSEGSQTPAVGQGLKDLKHTLQELSHNPILRTLLGESGFEGVKGKGGAHHGHKADRAGKAEKTEKGEATSEDAIKQLVEGLKKFVEQLQQLLGKKNETQAGAEGAGSTDAAGGTQSAGGSEGAGEAQAAGGSEGAEEAQAAGASEGAEEAQEAQGAEQAEEAKDPISQLIDTLQKIVGQLEQLLASFAKQNQSPNTGIVPPGGVQPRNTGIVPAGALEPRNTGIVPAGALEPRNTGIVPPGATTEV